MGVVLWLENSGSVSGLMKLSFVLDDAATGDPVEQVNLLDGQPESLNLGNRLQPRRELKVSFSPEAPSDHRRKELGSNS